jgi:hypothetical protein
MKNIKSKAFKISPIHFLPVMLAVLSANSPFLLRAQTTWAQLSTNGPMSARASHPAVLNTSNGRMIVFGGSPETPYNSALNDVWIFHDARTNVGDSWQQLTISGTLPSPRDTCTAVYDQANNRMIVFGGDPTPGYCYNDVNDVWVLTNADGTGGTPGWIQLSPTGTTPSGRSSYSAVYDPASNRLIVYGGHQECTFPPDGDLWVLTSANGLGGTPSWIQLSPAGSGPGPRNSHSAFYDAANNLMMLFGGQLPSGPYTNDTWVLSNANGLGGTPTWTLLNPNGVPPAPRVYFGGAYDPTINSLVIFGGATSTTYTNDTWILSNANGLGGAPTWTRLNPNGPLPTPRYVLSCVAVPGANRIVICDGRGYGNDIYGGNDINDVWALQYTPPPLLNIASAGNQSVIYWPAWATNYVLQTITNLSTANWVTVSNGAPIVGIVLTNALPAAFFRLRGE